MMFRRVVGTSMEPTLTQGQLVVVKTRFYRLEIGDIIMFEHRGLEKVKRIKKMTKTTIEVRGDNAAKSTDSRVFGPIKKLSVIGKVIVVKVRNQNHHA